MDQTLLVVNRVGAGEDLIHALRRVGFPISVAFWTQDVDDGSWTLVLATPAIDRESAREAYARVLDQVLALPSWGGVNHFELRLVSPRDRVARVVSAYAKQYVGESLHSTGSIRRGDVVLGQTYIYPTFPRG